MLDGWARRQIDPALDAGGRTLAQVGITANGMTIAGFVVGSAAAGAVVAGWFWTGLVLILLSRAADGLDGAIARVKGKTDLGGYLDIVLDFTFYGLIPLAFVIHDPAANGVAGALLLAVFYANGASFLAFATMAAKRGMTSDVRGPKSLFFTTGLAEATETIIVFAAFCIWPNWFAMIAYAFAAVTAYTTVSRLVLAWRVLRD